MKDADQPADPTLSVLEAYLGHCIGEPCIFCFRMDHRPENHRPDCELVLTIRRLRDQTFRPF